MDMVQVPGKGDLGCASAVPMGACSCGTRRGWLIQEAPAADAEQALEPVHAPARDHRATGLGVALDRHERVAEGVVARDEVAARAGADKRSVVRIGGSDRLVAGMVRVAQHGGLLGVVRSVECCIGRVLFGAPDFVR
jgi:hypothetical protein